MLFILCLFVCILIGIGIIVIFNGDFFGPLIIGMSTICLIFSLIFIPLERMEYHSKVAEYKAIKTTIKIIREEKKQVELTAIILEMVNINADIASARYWDGLLFGVYIPDEYVKLEYLK